MARIDAESRLNMEASLGARLADVLLGAERFEAAVAYAKARGVAHLRAAGLPPRSRLVLGVGFGLTDPEAVLDLDAIGAAIRIVTGSEDTSAAAFHPKLYLVQRGEELFVFSGSANLTHGGLVTNVEQYEELRVPIGSREAEIQEHRFESLWAAGTSLSDLRASGAWEDYERFAAARRQRDEELTAEGRRVAVRMQARVQSLRRQSRADSSERRAVPEELRAFITNPLFAGWLDELPEWVETTFSPHGEVWYHHRSTRTQRPDRSFTIRYRGSGRVYGWFQKNGIFLRPHRWTSDDVEWLRSQMKDEAAIRLIDAGRRLEFKIANGHDFEQAKRFIRRLIERID